MSKLYIVTGTTGEHSDRREWTVAAYWDEATAQAHAVKAKEWYDEHRCLERRYHDNEPKNPFDPFMYVDYTGTDWTVVWVEFRDKLPSEQAPQLAEPV